MNDADVYTKVIAELKILSIRCGHNGEEADSKRYRNAYEKLEAIRERRHLTPIGEEGKDKEAYTRALKMIEESYEGNKETIEHIIDGVESLCNEFDIKINKEEKGKKTTKENGAER